MTLMIWISYFILGIILVLLLDFLNRKYSMTLLQKMFFSFFYLIVIGGIFCCYQLSSFVDNLFIVFIFSFLIDLIYTTYFLDRDFFDKKEKKSSYYIFLVLVGFLLNQGYFNQVDSIFPTGEDFRLIVWVLILYFGIQFMKEKKVFDSIKKEDKRYFISDEDILVQYAKLRHRFREQVSFSNSELELIVYAIMIYYNRKVPAFKRKFDNIMFRLDGNSRKLGIMQIQSKKFINDEESILLGYKKIEKLSKAKTKNHPTDIILKYMGEESVDVNYIYEVIKRF